MIFRARPPDNDALNYKSQNQMKLETDPMNELKLRLARGEITMEQFLEMEKIFKR